MIDSGDEIDPNSWRYGGASNSIGTKTWTQRSKNFVCRLCNKAFTVRRDYIGHVNVVHYKCRPFKCPFCSKGYSTRKTMLEHAKKYHSQVASG